MKKILIALALITPLYAQRADTIYFPAITNSTVVGISPNITNIGQSFHMLNTSVVDVTPSSCTAWLGRIELQGSYDNSTWVRIGQPVSALTPAAPSITWANGALPFLRVNVIATTATCKLSVNYSGSLYGTRISALYDSTVKNGLVSASFTSGVGDTVIGGLCNNFVKNVSLYGFYINNTTAGTVTGIVIKIQDSVPFVFDQFPIGSLATLASVSMKSDSVPILGANQGVATLAAVPPVQVVLTSSAANLVGWILYRCE